MVQPDRGSDNSPMRQQVVRRSDRMSYPLAKLADYKYYAVKNAYHFALASFVPSGSSCICLYPIASFDTCPKFSPNHQSFLAVVKLRLNRLVSLMPSRTLTSDLPCKRKLILLKQMILRLLLLFLPTNEPLVANGFITSN